MFFNQMIHRLQPDDSLCLLDVFSVGEPAPRMWGNRLPVQPRANFLNCKNTKARWWGNQGSPHLSQIPCNHCKHSRRMYALFEPAGASKDHFCVKGTFQEVPTCENWVFTFLVTTGAADVASMQNWWPVILRRSIYIELLYNPSYRYVKSPMGLRDNLLERCAGLCCKNHQEPMSLGI